MAQSYDLTAQFQALHQQIAALNNALATTIGASSKATDGISKYVTRLQSDYNKISKTMAGIKSAIESIDATKGGGGLKSMAGYVSAVKSQFQGLRSDIANVNKIVNDLSRAVKKVKMPTDNSKIVERQIAAINKLQNELTQLKAKYKELNSAQRVNTKYITSLEKQVSTLKSVKEHTKRVGDEAKKTGDKTSSGFRKTAEALRLVAVQIASVYTIVRMLSNLGKTIVDFEYSLSGVKAVTGATNSELKLLRQTALDIGETSIFTAMQVGELELALGKLGFSTKEIVSASQAVSDLSAGFGGELGENAAIAGSTLRAFKIEAKDMTRVTDTMAYSFSKSALDTEKYAQSMKYIAPVAEKYGFTIEQTTSLLAKLADAGLYGSKAGTSLRNVILKLADGNSELNKRMGFSITNFDEFIAAMGTMNKAGFDLGDAFEITDQRAVTAMASMMGSVKEIDKFAKSMENINGIGERMANIRVDTIKGSLNKVASAWQTFIIETMNTEGFTMSVFNKGLISLAKNMKTVIKVGALLVGTLLSLRSNIILKGFNALKTSIINIRTAITTTTTAGAAMKATLKGALGLLPVLIPIAIGLYKKLTAHQRAVKKEAKNLRDEYGNERQEIGALVKQVEKLKGVDKKTMQEREELYALIEEKYPGILSNLDHEEGKLIDQLELLKEINKQWGIKIRLSKQEGETNVQYDKYIASVKEMKEAEGKVVKKIRELLNNQDEEAVKYLIDLTDMSNEQIIKLIESRTRGKDFGEVKGLGKVFSEYSKYKTKETKESYKYLKEVNEMAEAAYYENAELFKETYEKQAEKLNQYGLDPLKLYEGALFKIDKKLKEHGDNKAYLEQKAMIEELIASLNELNKLEAERDTITVKVSKEGMEEVLKINKLNRFEFQKTRNTYGDILKQTGLWADDLAKVKKEAEDAGLVFTEYDEERFFANQFKMGITGEAEWVKNALEKWNREYKSLVEQRDKILTNYGEGEKLTKSDLATVKYLEANIDAMETYKEPLLDLWESLMDKSGGKSGGKEKTDLTKVLKAIYEERKAYILQEYTDTKARDLLLIKLETEYQHLLSKITVENSDERLQLQMSNYNEFILKSKTLLRDYVKENKEAYRQLVEEDPFNLDTGDKAIQDNKKRFAEMRRTWNGQLGIIKGVSNALDVYEDSFKDTGTTMINVSDAISEELETLLTTPGGVDDMISIVKELQDLGGNVDSNYVSMLESGKVTTQELAAIITDIKQQIKDLTEESVKLEKQWNFVLTWNKIRNEAKITFDYVNDEYANWVENRKRRLGETGMSDYYADMEVYTHQLKSLNGEQERLNKLLEDSTDDLTKEQIDEYKKELKALGYTIDEIKRKIYDKGKGKTFLDLFTWKTKETKTDPETGEEEMVIGSLTSDQQEGIRSTVTFMSDSAKEMVNVWEEAINAIVSKYDELIAASDNRIGELQNDLDREKDLLIEGYANNYDNVKNELKLEREKRAELRKQRTEALEEQRRAQKIQQKIESLMQAANIFTTVTEIVKQYSKTGGPAGWVIGLGASALYMGLMAGIKNKVNGSYKMPTAREGATGVLTGKSHESGGEMIPIEAESG
ncbi:MAG: phage tail tape measure protein, partial [Bacteroidia bacterium]|nr:phage tail tape measure protein [Bacteroidia bacterium]